MKTIQLIITSLLATTAWAEVKNPHAFYAEVNNKLEPLTGAFYEEKNFKMNVLSYGNSSEDPVVFDLANDYATTEDTTTPGRVSLYKGAFVVASNLNPAVLEINSDFTIRDHSFKSCEMLDPPVRGITYRNSNGIAVKDCFDVKVFLLPYDEKTGKPVDGNYTPSKDDGNKSTKTEEKKPERTGVNGKICRNKRR